MKADGRTRAVRVREMGRDRGPEMEAGRGQSKGAADKAQHGDTARWAHGGTTGDDGEPRWLLRDSVTSHAA